MPMKTIDVRRDPKNPSKGFLRVGGLTLRAALGRSGIGILKREGDGRTPRAQMRLVAGFWRVDRCAKPSTRLPLVPISQNMSWCDAPRHGAYNRLVRLPIAASHERMFRDDHLYDICIVMDWNYTARRRGAGSAIFLHLARRGYKPTEGCIALAERDMRRLLAVIGRETVIRVP